MVGSYSTRACSWVRLTATLETPGLRPRAFSSVPVHSEQCRPPMRARNRARPSAPTVSSSQAGVSVGAGGEVTVTI